MIIHEWCRTGHLSHFNLNTSQVHDHNESMCVYEGGVISVQIKSSVPPPHTHTNHFKSQAINVYSLSDVHGADTHTLARTHAHTPTQCCDVEMESSSRSGAGIMNPQWQGD